MKLNIEVTKPSRNTLAGNALLKIIQNESMPWLDLLVRESIQNSLDAAKQKSRSIQVNFDMGNFDSKMLTSLLDGVSEKIYKNYPGPQQYIAVQDYGTVGLTGPLTHSELKEGVEEGNLISLVYDIMKAQDKSGAGGSWGLGKTTFYRIGIGLIIYYSRIENEIGEYEERLAINMVEDEKKSDYVPPLNGYKRQGVAWWGEFDGENKTKPITDSNIIKEILNIFQIQPYSNKETGTTIIMPYIDQEKLLISNSDITEKDERLPYWRQDIAEYLELSVQRWYSPRLNNPQYQSGPYLEVSINGEKIEKNETMPFYLITQDLYNNSKGVNKSEFNYDLDYQIESINLIGLFNKSEAGKVSYVVVDKKTLGETPPFNNPNIYDLSNLVNHDKEKKENSPLVLYTRKPGMVVAYENSGNWVRGIDNLENDEYLIAFFVLNSENEFKEELQDKHFITNIEEYIREGEKADHNAWHDKNYGNFNPRIVYKIQDQVARKLAKEVNQVEEVRVVSNNNFLSQKFGRSLLPNIGFGGDPRVIDKKRKTSRQTSRPRKSKSFVINEHEILYTKQDVIIPFDISLGNEESIEIYLDVLRDGGSVSANRFEKDMEDALPIEISNLSLNCLIGASKQNFKVSNDFIEDETDRILLEELKTDSGVSYGFRITNKTINKSECDGEITLAKKTETIKPIVRYR